MHSEHYAHDQIAILYTACMSCKHFVYLQVTMTRLCRLHTATVVAGMLCAAELHRHAVLVVLGW